MKEILERYEVLSQEYEEKRQAIEEKIRAKEDKVEELEDKIERAKKAIEKYENEIWRIDNPTYYSAIIKPLAKKLSEHFGMPYEIYGPFGLNAETSIYLRKNMNVSITKQPTISITLRPSEKSETKLLYDTGERTGYYKPGSIGYLNNMNAIFLPLPMEFDEILKLVRNGFEKADEEKEEEYETLKKAN